MDNYKALLLYFIPLFGFVVFVFTLIPILILKDINLELIPLIPGPLYVDLLFMFIVIPLVITLVGFLLSPLITIIYYGIHRLYRMFSKEHEYGILELPRNIPFKRLFYRIMFPAFFAISIGMMNFTTSSTMFLTFKFVPLYQVFMTSMFWSIPAFLLLAPLWILDDSGIVSYLKKDIGYRSSPETESVSRF